jgi:hypothetical protein
MRDGGKGDKPRPLGVPMEQFDKNFEAIFGKKKKVEDKPFGLDNVIDETNKRKRK